MAFDEPVPMMNIINYTTVNIKDKPVTRIYLDGCTPVKVANLL